MDTLALLCNLYGDGPQTLRRLREAGCGTLAALESIECERLASLLRTSVRSAKRFQAEGRLLRERSEPAPDRPVARTRDRATPRSVGSDPLVANVLSAWRERDAQGPGITAIASGTSAAAAPLHSPSNAPTGVGLAELDGMDGELLDRLARAGVGTPKALCDADVLDLAGRGVGGYTRLLHLQFLARRGGLEAPAPGPRAPQAPSSGAGPSAAEVTPDVDLIVPVRPPDRRAGAGRSAPTVEVPILRFSPRGEPPAAVRAVLEAELERFAAREVDGPAPGSEALPLEDAGSSGPFA